MSENISNILGQSSSSIQKYQHEHQLIRVLDNLDCSLDIFPASKTISTLSCGVRAKEEAYLIYLVLVIHQFPA